LRLGEAPKIELLSVRITYFSKSVFHSVLGIDRIGVLHHLGPERVDTVHLAEAVPTAIKNRDRERGRLISTYRVRYRACHCGIASRDCQVTREHYRLRGFLTRKAISQS
jgi:hypothetical protein